MENVGERGATADSRRGLLDLGPDERQRLEGEAEPVAEAPKVEENAKDLKEIDWGEYLETYGNEFQGSSYADNSPGDDDRRPSLENVLTKSQDLLGHLEWQLRLSTLSREEERLAAVV